MARVRDVRDALQAMEEIKGKMKPTTRFRLATIMSVFRPIVDNFNETQQTLVTELAGEDGTLPGAQALDYSRQLTELLNEVVDVKFRPIQYALIEKADMTPANLEALLRAGVVVDSGDGAGEESE